MSSMQEARARDTDPQSATKPAAAEWHADESRLEERESDGPRIIEEHHIVGPNGEDEIEAIDDRGRRWYDLRPEPRGAADVMGFNRLWWLALWVIVILLLIPWW